MILFENRKYEKINRFDCIVLDFDNVITRLPISPKAHREKEIKRGRTMYAGVTILKDKKYTHFHITDDWREIYKVSISNDMKNEIKTAKKAAQEQDLL